MEAVSEDITFEAIAPQDIEEFHRHREKIVTAVRERLERSPLLADDREDDERLQMVRESIRVFAENFYVTVKYQLPAALLEYLDWLRSFLRSRNFPATLLSQLLDSVRHATHAFFEQYNSDDIGEALHRLAEREKRLREVTA